MATNAAGLPYPVGGDLIAQGDNIIKALADKITWFQYGSVVLSGDGTNPRYTSVSFPVAFPRSPIVFCIPMTGVTNSSITQSATPGAITPTTVQINGVRSNSTGLNVLWIAFLLNGVTGP